MYTKSACQPIFETSKIGGRTQKNKTFSVFLHDWRVMDQMEEKVKVVGFLCFLWKKKHLYSLYWRLCRLSFKKASLQFQREPDIYDLVRHIYDRKIDLACHFIQKQRSYQAFCGFLWSLGYPNQNIIPISIFWNITLKISKI